MKHVAIIISLALSTMTTTQASELKLIAGGSLAGLFNELGPQFEKASGHTLSIHFDSTPNIIARVNSGAAFDVAVVPVDVFNDAAAKGRFAPGPTIDIARVGYGVIVPAGAPKPDISTPDAFKKTLLDAKSIASVPASAAGAYIAKVYERLGIGEDMKAKTRVQSGPTAIAPAVAKGEAELGIFVTNVFNTASVELADAGETDAAKPLSIT
jgi:molybdate transport system substrate-binding protein